MSKCSTCNGRRVVNAALFHEDLAGLVTDCPDCQVCPSCKGEKGYHNRQDGGYWEECGVCEGEGWVKT